MENENIMLVGNNKDLPILFSCLVTIIIISFVWLMVVYISKMFLY